MRAIVLMMICFGVATPASAHILLSATPVPGGPAASQSYRIRYGSVGADGRPQTLTGLLIEPRARAPQGGRPLVAWTHGTVGIREDCAPSEVGAPGFAQIAGLDAMIARGWTVVAPDYAGLGSRGPHPYLVADRTARAVADSIRAAAERPGTSRRIALWGHSQGGHAALVTAERAATLMPGFTLAGAAAAAPATDLAANFGAKGKATTKGVLTAFVTAAWAEVYDAPLATLGGTRSAQLVRRMADICLFRPSTNKLGTMVTALALGQRLKRVDVVNTPPWDRLLRQNAANPRAAARAAPLLITQGTKDDIVAPAVTREFARAACRAGGRVAWVGSPGGDHASQAERTSDVAVSWLSDRFAAARAPTDCARL